MLYRHTNMIKHLMFGLSISLITWINRLVTRLRWFLFYLKPQGRVLSSRRVPWCFSFIL